MSKLRDTALEVHYNPRVEKRIYFDKSSLQKELGHRDLTLLEKEHDVVMGVLQMQDYLDRNNNILTRPHRRLRNINYVRDAASDRAGSITQNKLEPQQAKIVYYR